MECYTNMRYRAGWKSRARNTRKRRGFMTVKGRVSIIATVQKGEAVQEVFFRKKGQISAQAIMANRKKESDFFAHNHHAREVTI